MLDWFTTIPGVLVICGAILLIIATIKGDIKSGDKSIRRRRENKN